MADEIITKEDSDKLIIYRGEDTDYAYIPINFDITENTTYAKQIINNDSISYLKKIVNNTQLHTKVEKQINSALSNEIGDSIKIDGTHNIYNNLSSQMLEKLINLYYIENFTYVLDQDETVNEDTNEVTIRGSKYMFTITPSDFKYNEISIEYDDNSSGGSGDDTSSGDSTDDNTKTYNINISASSKNPFTLEAIGTSTTYKLKGTLTITYKQSDETIKNDIPSIDNPSPNKFTFSIIVGSKSNTYLIDQIVGYNTTTGLWSNSFNIDLSSLSNNQYELTANTTVSCKVQFVNDKNKNPLFKQHGAKLKNYTGSNNFSIGDITVPEPPKTTYNSYFSLGNMQNSGYISWTNITLNADLEISTESITNKNSGIFIIISDNDTQVPSRTEILKSSGQTSNSSIIFKQSNKTYNDIFIGSHSSSDTYYTSEPPIFLYDPQNYQTKISSYVKDSTEIFDSYFTYNTGKKYTYSSSVKRNIINIANYKNIMYEYNSRQSNKYCSTTAITNDLSTYDGKIFNVMIELYNCNTLTLNKDNYLATTDDRLSSIDNINQSYDKITDSYTTTIYNKSLYLYKLYSFKFSTTPDSNNVGKYTYTL